MARGGYYVETDTRDFIAALRGTEHGLKDLRTAYRGMAAKIEADVQRHVPVYGGPNSMARKTRPGQKDGRGSLPAGSLRASVKGWASINGPWVSAGGAPAPHAKLQEWGGKSFWSRRGRGHVIYQKPRAKFGYFIWNCGYRLRDDMARWYYDAIRDVAMRNGIDLDVPAAPRLDIDPMGRD